MTSPITVLFTHIAARDPTPHSVPPASTDPSDLAPPVVAPRHSGDDSSALSAVRARVLAVVRDLARDVGGQRALRAVSSQASLERDVGLGSLERAELLVKLEQEFGRHVDGASSRIRPRRRRRATRIGPSVARIDSRRIRRPNTPRRVIAFHATELESARQSTRRWCVARAEPERLHVWLRATRTEEKHYGRCGRSRGRSAGLIERGVVAGEPSRSCSPRASIPERFQGTHAGAVRPAIPRCG